MSKPLAERMPRVGTAREMTIDQLAAAARMTVRNVRAYAGRGLIQPPRLVGRTGYYGKEHVDRLLLIRDLLDRGYTLAAIEEALEKNGGVPAASALEVLGVLSHPRTPQEPERIGVADLVRLAGVESDGAFVDELVAHGLVERVGEDELVLLQPAIVRAGAQAISLGLSLESVLRLLPFISTRMAEISEQFVTEVQQQMWQPFADAGYPADEWPEMLRLIEQLLPVAGQAVVAVFQRELNQAIDTTVGAEIENLGTHG